MSLKENRDFELTHWDGKSGASCGPRYVLDTVLHHEKNTNGLYKANRYMELIVGPTVIEIGCNAGGFTTLYSQHGYAVGLDLLHQPLAIARFWSKCINERNFDKKHWGEEWCHPPDFEVNCGWINAEASHLPFKDGAFNTVCMTDLIEHLPVHLRAVAIAEGIRIAKNRFIISTVTEVNDPNNPDWLDQILERVHPFGLLTEEELERWVRDCGVEIFVIETKWFGTEQFIKQILIGANK